ncbi:UNVERIFIED_CONTAM: Pentatricopeptide repeat-containing protein [Sesamum calycinum]|uniref:Pentatricopeptide repeat-containing protein n=1 Tax=Sesamum calycinum TaxID=2727403 RepID=A0AAW2NW80_9LAMI
MSQLSLRGDIVHARKIFDEMGVRDSVSWNVMIRCYLENELVVHARDLFDRMPERTSVSWNTMIIGYIKAGKFHMALKLFVAMPEKDVVSWTAIITGLCRASQVDDAWRMFKQMPEVNAVSWSSIVSGFQQNGFAIESLNVFREMLLVGIEPTPHLFTSVLSACADLAIVSHGYGLEAMMIFHQMQKAQVLPDGISYMGVLHGCTHCGFVQEGREYFQSMKMDYGISPGPEHFSAMVDLYARAGELKEAYEVILELPFKPTTIFWRTLLNGCRIWGNTELGVCAAEQILKLEPYNSSACLMVISIFTQAGKWKEVAKMRAQMRDGEARKELGCSWIDIKGTNHLFTIGDEIHPEADQIYAVVELLAYDMEKYYLRLDRYSDGLE